MEVGAKSWFCISLSSLHLELSLLVLLGEVPRKRKEVASRDNHLFGVFFPPNCSNCTLGSHESLRKATTCIQLRLHHTGNSKRSLARTVSSLFFFLFPAASLKERNSTNPFTQQPAVIIKERLFAFLRMHTLLLCCSWNVLGSICALLLYLHLVSNCREQTAEKDQGLLLQKKKKKSVLSEFNPVLFQVIREFLLLIYFQPQVCSPAEALLWAVFTGSALSLLTDNMNYLLSDNSLSLPMYGSDDRCLAKKGRGFLSISVLSEGKQKWNTKFYTASYLDH